MRIAIEINWGQKRGGARRYAIESVRQMSLQSPGYSFIIISSIYFKELSAKNISYRIIKKPSYLPTVLWDQIIFPHIIVPLQVNRIKPNVTLFTNNICPVYCKGKIIVSILDMTPFIIPEHYRYFHGLYQRLYISYASKYAGKVITISNNSAKDISTILNKSISDIDVVYCGNNMDSIVPQLTKRIESIIPERYILFVGAIHPRKNVLNLIKAFHQSDLAAKMDHKLIVVGAKRWQINKAIGNDNTGENIIFISDVEDSELAYLYCHCELFAFPSFYEGFGLPVLEAMSFGAPIITSNTSSLREIAEGAGVLIDPFSIDDISEAMLKIASNSRYRKLLRIKSYARSSLYSWESTAKLMLQVIEKEKI
jgi:glycosyltransferase involved in cell wall biosynthesis